jgi:hypothetical protein
MDVILLELLKGVAIPPFVENILIPGVVTGVIIILIVRQLAKSWGWEL